MKRAILAAFIILMASALPAAAQSICVLTGATTVSTRDRAMTLDLTGCEMVQTLSYSLASEGGGANFKNVTGTLLDTAASFTDLVGNKFQYLPEGRMNVLQFGCRGDWDGVDATAHDDLACFRAANAFSVLRAGSVYPGSGGHWGGVIEVPSRSYLLCGDGNSPFTVDNANTFEGEGNTWNATLRMCNAWNPNVHFIVGCQLANQFACFSSTLRRLNLSADRNVAAGNRVFMYYSEATQHDGGLYEVNFFAGKRGCIWYRKGWGGAANVTLQKIECNAAGNNAMIIIGDYESSGMNVGSVQFLLTDIKMGGPSSPDYQTQPGVVIFGGFTTWKALHCEWMTNCVTVYTPVPHPNNYVQTFENVTASGSGGGPITCSAAIQIVSGTVVASQIQSGGCSYTVLNSGPSGPSTSSTIKGPLTYN